MGSVADAIRESPNVPNYRVRGKGPDGRERLTLAIEPMVTLGQQDPRSRRRLDGRHAGQLLRLTENTPPPTWWTLGAHRDDSGAAPSGVRTLDV